MRLTFDAVRWTSVSGTTRYDVHELRRRWRGNHRFMFGPRRSFERGRRAWLRGATRHESDSVASTVVRLRLTPSVTGTRFAGRVRPSAVSMVLGMFFLVCCVAPVPTLILDPHYRDIEGYLGAFAFVAVGFLALRLHFGALAETRRSVFRELRWVLGDRALSPKDPSR